MTLKSYICNSTITRSFSDKNINTNFSEVDLKWHLTLSCDLEVRHNVKVPIVHLWFKFGCNRSEPVHAGAIWKRATITNLTSNNCNNLTSNDLWPCHVTSKSVKTWRFPLCTFIVPIDDPSLVVIEANLFEQNFKKVNQNNYNNLTSNDLWPCHVTSKSVIMRRFP